MSKYLRTIQTIDNIKQKVIICVDTCSNCPLMKLYENELIATCRICNSNENNNNIIDAYVINTLPNGEIVDEIKIPSWCTLPENMVELGKIKKTYTIYDDKLLISETDNNEDVKLPLYSASELIKDDSFDIMNMLPLVIAQNTLNEKVREMTSDEAYEAAYSPELEYACGYNIYDNYKPKLNTICSLCGKNHDSVKRDVNYGVCDDCLIILNKNKLLKKQVFINNFRLKRGAKFKKTTFNYKPLITNSLNKLIDE